VTTALRNVCVFDGGHLTEPTTVVLDGDLITAVDGAATGTVGEIVDGGGATLLPGLFDAHVHLGSPEDLAHLAECGITTALDMACWPPERVNSFRGTCPTSAAPACPPSAPAATTRTCPACPPRRS
jgi:dihydroorotase-like cyclic amidohydrolase